MAITDFFEGGGRRKGAGDLELPPLFPEQQDIYSRLMGGPLAAPPDILSFIREGMSSPLLQAVLEPSLAQYREGADRSRQAITDRFRASGGLRSGGYGVAAARGEGEIARGEGSLIADIVSRMVAPLLQSQLSAYSAQVDPLVKLFSAFPGASRMPGLGGTSDPWAGIPQSTDPWSRLSSSRNPSSPARGGGDGGGDGVNPDYDWWGNRRGVAPAVDPFTPYLDPMGGGNGDGGTWWDPDFGGYTNVPTSPDATPWDPYAPDWEE